MSDPVNHPAHYTDGKIEVADFIADKNMNFFLGNVVKYISRAGKKSEDTTVQDLRKAEWYLNREIERITSVDDRPAWIMLVEGMSEKDFARVSALIDAIVDEEEVRIDDESTIKRN